MTDLHFALDQRQDSLRVTPDSPAMVHPSLLERYDIMVGRGHLAGAVKTRVAGPFSS